MSPYTILRYIKETLRFPWNIDNYKYDIHCYGDSDNVLSQRVCVFLENTLYIWGL